MLNFAFTWLWPVTVSRQLTQAELISPSQQMCWLWSINAKLGQVYVCRSIILILLVSAHSPNLLIFNQPILPFSPSILLIRLTTAVRIRRIRKSSLSDYNYLKKPYFFKECTQETKKNISRYSLFRGGGDFSYDSKHLMFLSGCSHLQP
jgi:hypothetical protein